MISRALRIATCAALLGALLAPAAASAKGCPSRDARAMLRESGVGINGRVVSVRDDSIVVKAESSYAPDAVGYGETVRIAGEALPATPGGRIGIVLHRGREGFVAERCDVIPSARMSRAIRGRDPCPRPTVRIRSLTVEGRRARLTLRFGGDVTFVRIATGADVERIPGTPGIAQIGKVFAYEKPGTYRIAVRVSGSDGPGCGSRARRYAAASRTIVVR